MTANILKLVKKKNKMFHKVYNKKQTYTYSVYKQFRNSLNKTIKTAKNSYCEKLINLNKNNSKKLWQTLEHLVNFKSKTNKVPQSIVSDQGDDLYDLLNFANEFNNYFSEIGSRMVEKIPAPNGMPEHTATLCSSFYLYETSGEEVVRLIRNISDGKAINENDIPTKINKLAKFVLAPILTRIFNKCINEGFYPDCLKVAEVIPIYKSGEQKICSIYRPISILLPFNKIFERILNDRVYFYLQEYK